MSTLGIIQGFNAKTIAGQDQALPCRIVGGEGKHAAQVNRCLCSVNLQGSQEEFRIAMGSRRFGKFPAGQLPQLLGIVQLPVVDKSPASIRGDPGLLSLGEIANGQPAVRQDGPGIDARQPGVVGSAAAHAIAQVHYLGVGQRNGACIGADDSQNSAHGCTSLSTGPRAGLQTGRGLLRNLSIQ